MTTAYYLVIGSVPSNMCALLRMYANKRGQNFRNLRLLRIDLETLYDAIQSRELSFPQDATVDLVRKVYPEFEPGQVIAIAAAKHQDLSKFLGKFWGTELGTQRLPYYELEDGEDGQHYLLGSGFGKRQTLAPAS